MASVSATIGVQFPQGFDQASQSARPVYFAGETPPTAAPTDTVTITGVNPAENSSENSDESPQFSQASLAASDAISAPASSADSGAATSSPAPDAAANPAAAAGTVPATNVTAGTSSPAPSAAPPSDPLANLVQKIPPSQQQQIAQLDQLLQQLGIDPGSISAVNQIAMLAYVNDPAALEHFVQSIEGATQPSGSSNNSAQATPKTQPVLAASAASGANQPEPTPAANAGTNSTALQMSAATAATTKAASAPAPATAAAPAYTFTTTSAKNVAKFAPVARAGAAPPSAFQQFQVSLNAIGAQAGGQSGGRSQNHAGSGRASPRTGGPGQTLNVVA